MSTANQPYGDSLLQWDYACEAFQATFKFHPNELITIDTIREMFVEIVDAHELSYNASVSLMFALYFLGFITLVEIMKAKDENYKIGDLKDFYLILDAADQWAHLSDDANVLTRAAAPIIQNTQQVMLKLGLSRQI
jgi:hypothetical protein